MILQDYFSKSILREKKVRRNLYFLKFGIQYHKGQHPVPKVALSLLWTAGCSLKTMFMEGVLHRLCRLLGFLNF